MTLIEVLRPLICGVIGLLWLQATASAANFTNPIVSGGADPWVTFKDGYYYLTYTTGSNVQIHAGTRLTGTNGIGRPAIAAVYSPPPPYNQNVWAPELHFIGDKAYIYYAADNGVNANHRMFVAQSVKTGPTFSFGYRGKIYDAASDRWAIDGTVLHGDDGSLYLIWSGWPGTTDGVAQNLYIAPMSDPLTISGPRVLLSTPTNRWESWINEGPEVLKHNGMVFVVFAANQSWTDNECLGMLVNTNRNYLDPAAWTKLPTPVFATYTNATGSVYGPGHCGFTKSLDGTQDWIVYHAARTRGSGWDRNIRMQPFTWTADGLPDFGTPIPTSLTLPIPSGDAFTPARIDSISASTAGMQLRAIAPLPLLTNTWALESSPDLRNWLNLTNYPGLQYSAGVVTPPQSVAQFYRVRSER